MRKYRLVTQPDPSEMFSDTQNSYKIWVDGPRDYFDRLARAFPLVRFDFFPHVGTSKFSWCARVLNPTEGTVLELDRCLQTFGRTLCIETPLDECFALGWHSKPGQAGKPPLTTLGQWVHMAKSYGADSDSGGSLPVAGLIAEQMAEFIRRHPLYRSCDGVVAVLPSNPEKAFDLPTSLAESLEEDCGIPFLREAIFKIRLTAQMKYCHTREEKLDNVAGSIGVHEGKVAGKRLLVIDDILESGITLAETARALHGARIDSLYGLVATKTLKRKFP